MLGKNKPSLVAQGFHQEEGSHNEETLSPIVEHEMIYLLGVFASYKRIKLF